MDYLITKTLNRETIERYGHIIVVYHKTAKTPIGYYCDNDEKSTYEKDKKNAYEVFYNFIGKNFGDEENYADADPLVKKHFYYETLLMADHFFLAFAFHYGFNGDATASDFYDYIAHGYTGDYYYCENMTADEIARLYGVLCESYVIF